MIAGCEFVNGRGREFGLLLENVVLFDEFNVLLQLVLAHVALGGCGVSLCQFVPLVKMPKPK